MEGCWGEKRAEGAGLINCSPRKICEVENNVTKLGLRIGKGLIGARQRLSTTGGEEGGTARRPRVSVPDPRNGKRPRAAGRNVSQSREYINTNIERSGGRFQYRRCNTADQERLNGLQQSEPIQLSAPGHEVFFALENLKIKRKKS